MNKYALSALCSSYGNCDCPCVLSVLNECLVCSHLQGQEFCDCQWNKYCVFINYLHDGYGSNIKPNDEFLVPVRQLDMGSCGHLVFLTAPRPILEKTRSLDLVVLKGRPPLDLEIPAVVISTYPKYGLISLGIKPLAQTTKPLLKKSDCFEMLSSGIPAIPDLSYIKQVYPQKILIVAENIGVLLVEPLIRHYLPMKNQLVIVLNHHLPFVQRKLHDRTATYRFTQQINKKFLSGVLEETSFDTCFSFGDEDLNVLVNEVLSFQKPAISIFNSSLDSLKTNSDQRFSIS